MNEIKKFKIEDFSEKSKMTLDKYRASLNKDRMTSDLLERPNNVSINEWIIWHNSWLRGFLMANEVSIKEEFDLAKFAEQHDFWCKK